MLKTTRQGRKRADDLTALLERAPKPDEHDKVRQYAHSLMRLGVAVLLINPGDKSPFGGVSDDNGNRGLHTATTDATVFDGYLDGYRKVYGSDCAINLGAVAKASRMVLVDCDTRDQTEAFLSDDGMSLDTLPTVTSPGTRGPDGTWAHEPGNGHYWFTVPEDVELPTGSAAMTVGGEGGYAVKWGNSYVLIPPSTRKEGPYTGSGPVRELPDWLRDRIIQHGSQRDQRAARGREAIDPEDPIAQWGATTSWAEILEPTEWTNTGKSDNCGCDIWTAPGMHASPKSATAHEVGCSTFTDSPDPPLMVWTDHDVEPFERYLTGGIRTVSRFQAYAAIHHDGNMGAAMDALHLHEEPVTLGGEAALNLPDAFWEANPVLSHIRHAAHREVNSADAVFGALLARLAANLDPAVKVDTGIKTAMPLNMFAGLVGSAGTGKSSAYSGASGLIDLNAPPSNPYEEMYETPRELPVGTGPGVAEAFMGSVVDDPLHPKKQRREQVFHKLLLHSDEGASLVAGIIDNKRGQDIGPTLRAAWSGEMLGQANASTDRKREVLRGSYTLGLCVNFQLEALAAMSTPEQLEYGTPQRFVYFSATDPAIPYDAPPDPGRLIVQLPTEGLHYCDELKAKVRREAVERSRGQASGAGNPMEVHQPAMRARLAALLVILCNPGRTVIDPDDVELADMILDTSARIHDTAMEWRSQRESAEWERQSAARISERVAMEIAVDDRGEKVAGMQDRIIRYFTEAGGQAAWKGQAGLKQKKFKGDERQLADAAYGRMVKDGELIEDGRQTRLP